MIVFPGGSQVIQTILAVVTEKVAQFLGLVAWTRKRIESSSTRLFAFTANYFRPNPILRRRVSILRHHCSREIAPKRKMHYVVNRFIDEMQRMDFWRGYLAGVSLAN